jgi:hypothetical protein
MQYALNSFSLACMLVFLFVFLKAISHPVGVLEDVTGEREIELGGQTTTTATAGMKLG